jgi:hypothetical protein
VRTRHGRKVDRLAIGGSAGGSVALVVPEAVLDADDDPEVREDDTKAKGDEEEQG